MEISPKPQNLNEYYRSLSVTKILEEHTSRDSKDRPMIVNCPQTKYTDILYTKLLEARGICILRGLNPRDPNTESDYANICVYEKPDITNAEARAATIFLAPVPDRSDLGLKTSESSAGIPARSRSGMPVTCRNIARGRRIS